MEVVVHDLSLSRNNDLNKEILFDITNKLISKLTENNKQEVEELKKQLENKKQQLLESKERLKIKLDKRNKLMKIKMLLDKVDSLSNNKLLRRELSIILKLTENPEIDEKRIDSYLEELKKN